MLVLLVAQLILLLALLIVRRTLKQQGWLISRPRRHRLRAVLASSPLPRVRPLFPSGRRHRGASAARSRMAPGTGRR